MRAGVDFREIAVEMEAVEGKNGLGEGIEVEGLPVVVVVISSRRWLRVWLPQDAKLQ